ncbi:MAG TPA: CBS domain-containing protein [Rudaea sp.]
MINALRIAMTMPRCAFEAEVRRMLLPVRAGLTRVNSNAARPHRVGLIEINAHRAPRVTIRTIAAETTMRIADICSQHVICIEPGASLSEAAALMRRQQVGALVVTDPDRHPRQPFGIVTDRDIVVGVVAAQVGTEALTVADVMARSLATCRGDDDLFDVVRLMRTRGVRRLPVVDAQGLLVGIVTADDLVGALADHLSTLAGLLVNEEAMEERRTGAQRRSA